MPPLAAASSTLPESTGHTRARSPVATPPCARDKRINSSLHGNVASVASANERRTAALIHSRSALAARTDTTTTPPLTATTIAHSSHTRSFTVDLLLLLMASRCSEHVSQTTRKQRRQWCRRKKNENVRQQSGHALASRSACQLIVLCQMRRIADGRRCARSVVCVYRNMPPDITQMPQHTTSVATITAITISAT
jgi:hypothetical protein